MGHWRQDIPHPIPNSTNIRLVEQEGLNRDLLALQLLHQPILCDNILIHDWIGPVLLERSVLANIVGGTIHQADTAEPAGIDKSSLCLRLVAGFQQKLPVPGGPLLICGLVRAIVVCVGILYLQPARHPKMHHCMWWCRHCDPEVFPLLASANDLLPLHRLLKLGCAGPNFAVYDIIVLCLHLGECLSDQMLTNEMYNARNLCKLRHID